MLAFAPSRRTAALVVLVLSLGTLGFLWFGESDEQKVVRALDELADVAGSREGESLVFRTARLNGAFKDRLEPEVSLDAPELGRVQGIRSLVELAAAAPRVYGDFQLSLAAIEVSIDSVAKRAEAAAEATLAGADGRRESRRVKFHLSGLDGEWKVTGIEVAQRSD